MDPPTPTVFVTGGLGQGFDGHAFVMQHGRAGLFRVIVEDGEPFAFHTVVVIKIRLSWVLNKARAHMSDTVRPKSHRGRRQERAMIPHTQP